MARKLSRAARVALERVTGKRARIVVDHILRHGSITTDDLKEKYGYDHPPRAIKDVSDQGIPLVKTIVRKDDGKRMARYEFGDLENIASGRSRGRASFPKAFKESLLACSARDAPSATQPWNLATSRLTIVFRTSSRATARPRRWTWRTTCSFAARAIGQSHGRAKGARMASAPSRLRCARPVIGRRRWRMSMSQPWTSGVSI